MIDFAWDARIITLLQIHSRTYNVYRAHNIKAAVVTVALQRIIFSCEQPQRNIHCVTFIRGPLLSE